MTAKPSTGHRVLVVGCERSLVKYFSVFLKIFSYKVDTALSVDGAFHKALAHPPNILIIMMLMPEVSGVDVGLRICHQSGCSALFLTTVDTDFSDMLERARGEGCDCTVLSLPFENSDLLAKLQSLAA